MIRIHRSNINYQPSTLRALSNKITTLFYSFIIILSIILLGLFNGFVILDIELVEQASDIKHIYLIEEQEKISINYGEKIPSLDISGALNMESQPTGGPSNGPGLPGGNNNEDNISQSGSGIESSNNLVGLESGVTLHNSSTDMVTLQSASLQSVSDHDTAIEEADVTDIEEFDVNDLEEADVIDPEEMMGVVYNTETATGSNIFLGSINIEDIPAELIVEVSDLIQASTNGSLRLSDYVMAVSQSPQNTFNHLQLICFPGDLIQLLNEDVNDNWLNVNKNLAEDIINHHQNISDDINEIINKYRARYESDSESDSNMDQDI